MKLFKHTFLEPGLWRGWLNDGQSVEISWNKRGWDFGCGLYVHGDDHDRSRRLWHVAMWKLSIWLPIGFSRGKTELGDEPQWSISASGAFGLNLHWRHWRKHFEWPWSWHTLAYEKATSDGWKSVFDDCEHFLWRSPYKYVLKSGEVQNRIATVSLRRHVICYRAFKAIGWPRWRKKSIDVGFDAEVGERTGSWKGGVLGCGYDLRKDESIEQCLRRMEAEAPRVKVTFKVGERVRIIDGPFNDFRGTVAEIDMERTKVRVMVNFFGRETPVELDFLQVEKS